MRLLQYKDLDLKCVKPAFAKVRAAIEAGDFKSPDVKKLHTGGYYRAKLDHSNRLLLQFARHGGQTVCLALEVIENHTCDKSRFLRGARVDEAKIEHEPGIEAKSAAELDAQPLRWLHATRAELELLDKPIVFDDAQEAVRRLPAPVVLVGSAGSGKTAVTLAKLREASGLVSLNSDMHAGGITVVLPACAWPMQPNVRHRPDLRWSCCPRFASQVARLEDGDGGCWHGSSRGCSDRRARVLQDRLGRRVLSARTQAGRRLCAALERDAGATSVDGRRSSRSRSREGDH